jgi:hypothetical protein
MTDVVYLRISGRLYSQIPRWHSDRLKRLIAAKIIRTHAQVDDELQKLRALDQRAQILGPHAIEIDGARFDFKRKPAEDVWNAMADGTFKYVMRSPGWLTADELDQIMKISWIGKRRNGTPDFRRILAATDAQKAAIQVQEDEITGRDLNPDDPKFRKETGEATGTMFGL